MKNNQNHEYPPGTVFYNGKPLFNPKNPYHFELLVQIWAWCERTGKTPEEFVIIAGTEHLERCQTDPEFRDAMLKRIKSRQFDEEQNPPEIT